MRGSLDFEKPVAEIEAKLEELRALDAGDSAAAIGEEVTRLEVKAAQTLRDLYASLTPWQKTQVARHPDRPHCLDYVAALITDFVPLAGDRKFGDDQAIVGGFGRFHGESGCVIGHEKGSGTEDRLKHNFGMARPEGYRKAERLMQMADRFGIPVISLVDTPGAYPGIGAEERAPARAQAAAPGMKIPAQDMIRFGVIDQIVTEPIGGAHRDPAAAIASADSAILAAMDELKDLDRATVRRQRWAKFLAMGRTLG